MIGQINALLVVLPFRVDRRASRRNPHGPMKSHFPPLDIHRAPAYQNSRILTNATRDMSAELG